MTSGPCGNTLHVIIINFGDNIFLCLPPYNSNFQFFEIRPLVYSNLRDSTVYILYCSCVSGAFDIFTYNFAGVWDGSPITCKMLEVILNRGRQNSFIPRCDRVRSSKDTL